MDLALKNRDEIQGTHWIQFYISETATDIPYWADQSKYLDEFAYNLWTDLFERNADVFHYYGNTVFNYEHLKGLKNDIAERIKTVERLQTLEDFTTFGEQTSHALNLSREIEKSIGKEGEHIKIIIRDIKELGLGLLDLIDECMERSLFLCVLGL